MEGIPKIKRMAHEGMTLSKGTCLSHGGVPDPNSKDLRFGRGGFLGCVGLGGGQGRGFGFLGGEGGGLCWGGAACTLRERGLSGRLNNCVNFT